MYAAETLASMTEVLTIVHPEYDGRGQASRGSTPQHQGHALLNHDWLDFLLRPQGGPWIIRRWIHTSVDESHNLT